MDESAKFPLMAPPRPLPKRRNVVLRLYDAPLHRDWIFWLTVTWAAIAGVSIPAYAPPSAIPIWLNTLLAVIFWVVVGGIVPAWFRLVMRRWRWRRRQPQDSQPTHTPGEQAAPRADKPYVAASFAHVPDEHLSAVRSRRTVEAWGAGSLVVVQAVAAALINELHGGWEWWVLAGLVVVGWALTVGWLAYRADKFARVGQS
ncbi:MAG: hypothetical protein LC776_10425 [Acidobacteria bacterium]|nr:hypothetical protein [Acidobacteriota bacterium]